LRHRDAVLAVEGRSSVVVTVWYENASYPTRSARVPPVSCVGAAPAEDISASMPWWWRRTTCGRGDQAPGDRLWAGEGHSGAL